MVWAGISWNFKTDLHIVRDRLNAMTYRDTILQPIVVPFMRNNGLTLLQQDNARQHTARITTDCRQRHAMAFSYPDLKHLWDELGRRVRDRPVSPQNRQLGFALNQEWARNSQNVVRRYVHSMRSVVTQSLLR